jgi:DNA repair protein RadA/Sms
VSLHTFEADTEERLSTGVSELDRVLGGGLLAGSTTLLFGEPGVGKSTLALMSLRSLAMSATSVLLIGAEESASQVAQRARRLGPVPEGLDVATTTSVAATLTLIEQRRPHVCVIDSISAMSDDELSGVAGSVPQVRNAAERLCALAKTTLRVVRALKHRFGPTGEVGLLEMVGEGLRDLPDAALALGQKTADVSGVVFTVTNDGSRSFLVEVQALVASSTGAPRRVAHQVSSQRLSLMLAVLEARCDIDVSGLDVFAATAGGLAAVEPGVDLALALAVASAAVSFAVPRSLVAVGEVGLAGELRAVSGLSRRVREAQRLGAQRVVVPAAGELDGVDAVGRVEVIRCATLAEAISASRGH